MTREDLEPGLTFVGGVPRSGTSLLQKILDLHPAVYAGPEMSIVPQLAHTYRMLRSNIESGKLSMVLDADAARAAYQEFIMALFQRRVDALQPRMISEKTPTNLFVFDTLAEIFPGARFIWVVRDPRDVICSFRAVQARGKAAGTRVQFGRFLTQDIRTIQSYHRAGESFRASHPQRLQVVHYEDLVRNPVAQISALCDFLDLDFDEGMLRTERSNDTSLAIDASRPTRGVYYDRATFDRPIDGSGIGRWQTTLRRGEAGLVAAGLGPERFPSLAPYDLAPVARRWKLLLRVSGPVLRVARHLPDRRGIVGALAMAGL